MNRKRLLITLLGLLICSLAYAFWNFPRQQRVALTAPAAPVGQDGPKHRRSGAGSGVAAEDDLRVHLELLTRGEEKVSARRRDLFAPLFTVSPPPSPAPPPSAPPPAPAALQPVAMVPPQPPPPLPELARFTFLGFLQKEGEKTVFLSSGEEIFVVKKGDRFGRNRQFLVTEMTPQRLIVRQGEDPRPITLSLVEQAPLAPAAGLPRNLARPLQDPALTRLPYRRAEPVPPLPAATPGEGEGVTESVPVPADRGTDLPAQAPEVPGQGLLQPVQHSDFNNLFSPTSDGKSREGKPVKNGSVVAPGEVPQ